MIKFWGNCWNETWAHRPARVTLILAAGLLGTVLGHILAH